MKTAVYFYVLLILCSACARPQRGYSDLEIKRESLKHFHEIKDTSDIAVLTLSPEPTSQWKVAYNIKSDTPQVLFYNNIKKKYTHKIWLPDWHGGYIENVTMRDYTGEGDADLAFEVVYNEGLSYYRREFRVYMYPFRRKKLQKIFFTTLQERWGKVTGFRDTTNNPKYVTQIDYDATVRPEHGTLVLEGNFKGQYCRSSLKWDGEKFDWAEAPSCFKDRVQSFTIYNGQRNLGKKGTWAIQEDSTSRQIIARQDQTEYLLLQMPLSYESASTLVWHGNTAALAVLNPEEYPEHVRVYMWNFPSKGAPTLLRTINTRIRYTCDDSECEVKADEDFYFDNKGRLHAWVWKRQPEEEATEQVIYQP